MADQFQYLFTPIQIGPVKIRNRVFSPPYETNLVEDEAKGWWDRQAHFHAERAKGGIGLIIMSEICAHPAGGIYTMMPIDERHVPHLRKLTDLIHSHGAKIFQLIHNPGRQARPLWSHHANWGPSPVRGPFNVEIPHEMDKDDIREMVASYARTAKLLKDAGFDGIELQGAHGFLIGSFLSPASNKRSDEYGGSIENRLRFLNEIVGGIRESIGREVALGSSLSIDELNPAGISVEESLEVVARLDSGGMLDYVETRVGDYASIPIWVGDMSVAPGAGVPYAAAVKQTVKLPVLTVLRIKDPIHAERILADGQADMVGMGRATLCDPELVRKAETGRAEEIRYCISCNQGCIGRVQAGLPIECVLNPVAGLERQYGAGKIRSASRKKRVVVVGGGPAGLKAAETAASRGHSVILLERDAELGGQILLASRLPGREEVGEATSHLTGQIRRLGVQVHLRTEATPEKVKEYAPDAVIVATGSAPVPPSVPGMDGGVRVYHAIQIIKREVEVGDSAVVFDCGESHWKFCGTAELLAQQGKRVTLITPRLFVGFDLPLNVVPSLHQRLAEYDATIIVHTVVSRIDKGDLVLMDVFSKSERRMAGVDTLVWAGDNRVSVGLYEALKGAVPELYRVGDCVAPRKIDAAIREGFFAALKIE
jgi:mycofactocin system FadH/OYE family oxidoreductase 2